MMASSTSDRDSKPDAAYLLNHISNHKEEQDRLNIQHTYLRSMLHNNKLFPSVVMQSGAKENNYLPLAIADIACGTGIFLNELAREDYAESNVKARLIGFDVTADRFSEVIEPGVELLVHDCQQPYPDEFLGKFDAVNIRLIWPAIRKDKMEQFLVNAVKLLKPGGYLQWIEGDSQDFEFTPTFPAAKILDKYMTQDREARGLMTNVPPQMLQALLDVRNHEELDILRYEVVKPTSEIKKDVEEKLKTSFANMIFRALLTVAEGQVKRFQQKEKDGGAGNEADLKVLEGVVMDLKDAIGTPGKWDAVSSICVSLAKLRTE